MSNRYCRVDWKETGASYPRGARAQDFVNFREKNYASRARGAPTRVWQFTLPRSRSGTFASSLARRDHRKSKIWTSSPYKAKILIFDDPAELESWQRPKFCFTQLNSTCNRTCCKTKGKNKEPAAHAIPPWSPTRVLSMPERA